MGAQRKSLQSWNSNSGGEGHSLAAAGALKEASEAGSVNIERIWKLEPTTAGTNCSCMKVVLTIQVMQIGRLGTSGAVYW